MIFGTVSDCSAVVYPEFSLVRRALAYSLWITSSIETWSQISKMFFIVFINQSVDKLLLLKLI